MNIVPPPSPPRSARILVVDDREEDRHLLADYLRREGYRLYVAEDGRDGVEKALYVQPDLILMDIHMPVCDGIAACRLLKAEPRTMAIPLIFLTAAALPEERVRGLLEGAVDYITKPINPPVLLARVKTHLTVKASADFLRDQNHYLEEEVARQSVTLLYKRPDGRTQACRFFDIPSAAEKLNCLAAGDAMLDLSLNDIAIEAEQIRIGNHV